MLVQNDCVSSLFFLFFFLFFPPGGGDNGGERRRKKVAWSVCLVWFACSKRMTDWFTEEESF